MLRKWFELSGVAPLAVYVVVHSFSYAGVLFGRSDLGSPAANAVTLVLEFALVWVPFLFHAGYGLTLCLRKLDEAAKERQRSLILRLSGVLSLGFVLAHAVWLRAPLWRGERSPEDVAQELAAGFSTTTSGIPLVAALHVVGIAAVAAHLGAGLARFFESWGILRERAAERAARSLALAVFALGSASVVELATGSLVPAFMR